MNTNEAPITKTKLESIFATLTFLAFCIHLFVGLERTLFINEVFSLLSLIFTVRYFFYLFSSKAPSYQIYLSLFFIWTSLVFITSPLTSYNGNPYQILRTLPIYYSSFCLFLGIWLAKNAKSLSLTLKILVPIAFFTGGKLSPPVGIALSSYTRTLQIGLLVLLMPCLFVYKYIESNDGNSTLFIVTIISIFIGLFPTLSRTALLFLIKPRFLVFITLCFIYLTYLHFPDYRYILTTGLLFSGSDDANTVWRLGIWAISIDNLFQTNALMGIGLGSPVFDPNDPSTYFITNANPNDENLPYTLGLHNSYLTIAVRYGLVGYTTFVLASLGILRAGILLYGFQGVKGSIFLATFLFNIAALFNVILESSLYSGSYWILTGICFAILRYDRG